MSQPEPADRQQDQTPPPSPPEKKKPKRVHKKNPNIPYRPHKRRPLVPLVEAYGPDLITLSFHVTPSINLPPFDPFVLQVALPHTNIITESLIKSALYNELNHHIAFHPSKIRLELLPTDDMADDTTLGTVLLDAPALADRPDPIDLIVSPAPGAELDLHHVGIVHRRQQTPAVFVDAKVQSAANAYEALLGKDLDQAAMVEEPLPPHLRIKRRNHVQEEDT